MKVNNQNIKSHWLTQNLLSLLGDWDLVGTRTFLQPDLDNVFFYFLALKVFSRNLKINIFQDNKNDMLMDCNYYLLSGNLNIHLKTKKQVFKKYLVIKMHRIPISPFLAPTRKRNDNVRFFVRPVQTFLVGA